MKLKQLFCKHHYIRNGDHIKDIKHFDHEYYIIERVYYKDYVCTKCGKKKSIYEYSKYKDLVILGETEEAYY